MAKLTHLSAAGEAHMVDVGAKDDSQRVAEAMARVQLSQTAYDALVAGNLKKGDALGVARIAGIMAAKKTSELIPLCHPIAITKVAVSCVAEHGEILIHARVECIGKTGVEMEALTAASIAALTIYDMAKAIDKGIRITDVQLVRKTGGKSGDYIRQDTA